VCGVVPPQVRDFALPIVELYEVPVCTFLQPVEVSLTRLVYQALLQVVIFPFLLIHVLRFVSTSR